MHRFVEESKELQVYRSLQGRKVFTRNEQITYYNAKQGYKGEKEFSRRLVNQLTSDCIVLYDILLDNKGTLFQIDCLVFYSNILVLLEVKNYRGEFKFEDERLYGYTADKHYPNPLHQLQRSHVNLQELLSKLKVNLPLDSYIVFVNMDFTLYTTRNPTIILPTQINTFIDELNQIPSKLNQYHQRLASQIGALHIQTSPYERLPSYEFSTLRRGVLCIHCRLRMKLRNRQLFCERCTYIESIDSGVLRNVIEFNMLFPETKMTTPGMVEWCALDISSRTIRRILKSYLTHCLHSNHSYFKFDRDC